jgi:CheY-like chemotaxis protein
MAQRIFVKVLGFSPAERHALNTLFRLSELRETVYSLWEPQAPEPPRLALVDGRSQEAHQELGPADKSLKLIWIGSVAPASSWRSFERPLFWPTVIQAMDELFAPPGSLDLELNFDDAPQTLPPGAPGWDASPPLRALIASCDRDQRLYLRARLALAELTQVDEAQTGAEALQMARANPYCVALVDFRLPDVDGWTLLRALHAERPAIAHLIATKASPSLVERLRARWGGMAVLLGNPPQPATLSSALAKVGRRRAGHFGLLPARHPH